jgi:dTMP kinase
MAFIVLEGLDGAGTTTQARMLQEYFTHCGHDSFPTFEPSDGVVGAFTRGLLSGNDAPSQRVLGLLFAADRLEHTNVIRAELSKGRHVVCDRYIFSSMAYQTLDAEISAEWVAQTNAGCAIPDLTVFIDVPVEVCLQRIRTRNGDRTLYERDDRLRAILDNYRRLMEFYRSRYGRLVTVDGTAPPGEVHSAVVAQL